MVIAPLLLKVFVFFCGAFLVFFTIMSAIRMLVLPRSDRVWLTTVTFKLLLRLFQLRMRLHKQRTYETRDRVMALFAPIAVLSMPIIWMTLVTLGYTAMYWALGIESVYDAFHLSGSSLLTLGYAPVNSLPTMLLSFTGATIGLGLVALLISYLPTMYSAFSRREKFVAMLEIRAGSPPSAVTMIQRLKRNQGLDYISNLWADWEEWFIEVEESHTSLAPLIFFRSPQPDKSWVTAAGAVLDSAALYDAAVNQPRDINGVLCIRAGYIALRRIADFFDFPYDSDPKPTDPISISRTEFNEACEELAEAGIELVDDLDAAWENFRGWRVNYDTVLIFLARITMAPYAPWSSDRSIMPHKNKNEFTKYLAKKAERRRAS